jgi:hypothetical protein
MPNRKQPFKPTLDTIKEEKFTKIELQEAMDIIEDILRDKVVTRIYRYIKLR